MGKASSAKKIKRVQQAGVSRAPGQRRNLGYPALIIAILVVGSVLVFLARDHRAVASSQAPVANKDHWHSAFGINICGTFQENLADVGPDTTGIHTHLDGLIHIHPFVGAAAGSNATFGVFADQTGLTVGDGVIRLPDGTTYEDGDECDGEPGRVALYQWPPQATDATEPTIITTDIGSTRLTKDGEIFVLSFNPEDAEVPLPPSLAALANPEDLQTTPQQGSTDYVSTTAPEPGEEPAADEQPAGEEPGDDDGSDTTEAPGEN